MALTQAFTLRDPAFGATVPSFGRTLENTPHQQRLPFIQVLSASIPLVNAGEPMGEFSTDVMLYGVPRRASKLEISNELISVGLNRLAEGVFVRQGADMHVCIKLNRSLTTAGAEYANQLSDLKRRLWSKLAWKVSVKQCARRTTESGPPLPLLMTHEISPQWAMPSGNREMRVGTINARGMTQSKQMEIEDLLLEYGVSICAVQESHERGSMAQHFLHYTWISRPRSRDHIKKGRGGGVGFLVHNSLVANVSVGDTTGSQEVMWLLVDGSGAENLPLILASVYMPCESYRTADRDLAFERLGADLVQYQQRGRVVLLGDFNARVGQALVDDDHIGRYGETTINGNGKRLITMLSQNNMYVVNGRYRQELAIPQYTYRSTVYEEAGSVLDYVVVDRDTLANMANSQIKMESVRRSDHMLLMIPVPFDTRPLRKMQSRRETVWRLQTLRQDVTVQENYCTALGERLATFLGVFGTVESDATLPKSVKLERAQKLLSDMILPAAVQSIGRMTVGGNSQTRWWDQKVKQAVSKRRTLLTQLRSHGTMEGRQQFKIAAKALTQILRKKLTATKKNEMRLINALAKNRGDSKALWKQLDWRRPHILKGAQTVTPTVRMPGTNGRLVCDEPRVCEAFKHEFESNGGAQTSQSTEFDEDFRLEVEGKVAQYSLEASRADASELGMPITELEVEEALRATKSHKISTQGDPLVNELLRYGGAPLAQALVPLFNMALCEAQVPAVWRVGEIFCLHKKGDKSAVSNYRGITIMSALGKLYTRVLNKRLMDHLNPLLHEAQCGFRPDRNCMDHVLSASQVIQGRLRAGTTTYGLFLDGQKAFDSVWRDGLFFKLWAMGVRGRMWLAIRGLMQQTSSRVRIGSTLSGTFQRFKGIDQGCMLSPTLYLVFINDLLSEVDSALDHTNPVHPAFTQGAYADDYFCLSGNASSCQLMADACRSHSLKWRWVPNLGKDKTAVVIFRPRSNPASADTPIMWGTTVIGGQSTYRLLGITLSSTGTWDAHLEKLLVSSTARVNLLAKFLGNKYMTTPLKLMLIKSCLLPVLEYGSDVWHAAKTQAGLLTTQYLRALKMVLQCPTPTPTAAVLHDTGMTKLESLWDLNKLRLANRLQHLSDTRSPKAVYGTIWAGRGRKLMWVDKIKNIWDQLIPDAAIRGGEVARLLQLSRGEFKTSVRQLVVERDEVVWQRDLRSKPKLALYKDVCDIEQHNISRQKVLAPKIYLKGCFTAAKRLKFNLRAGIAELNEEIERKTRGNRSLNAIAVKSCPFCPGMTESQTHFIVTCSQYDAGRVALWENLQGVIPITTVESLKRLPAQKLAAQLLSDTMGGEGLLSQSSSDFTAAARFVEDFLWASWNIRKRLLPPQ